MVATPNIATAANMMMPVRRWMGQRARLNAIRAAPTAGPLRSTPRPIGPACNMSRA